MRVALLYRFEDLEKSYGPHDVLKGATWQHNPGEHVGLVGRNGAGKTTLFRLLLKQEEPDRGTILRASGLTIGHVGQHLDAEPGMSMFDYVETAFSEVLAIDRKMRANCSAPRAAFQSHAYPGSCAWILSKLTR